MRRHKFLMMTKQQKIIRRQLKKRLNNKRKAAVINLVNSRAKKTMCHFNSPLIEIENLIKIYCPDMIVEKNHPRAMIHGTGQKILDNRKYNQDEESCVYIIGNKKAGFIKIGYTTNLINRLSVIQTGCPYKLYVYAVFNGRNQEYEQLLHDRAEEYRVRGEWFRIEGKLKNYLDTIEPIDIT